MTFRAAVERERTHSDSGRQGWELLALDMVADQPCGREALPLVSRAAGASGGT